MNPELPHTVNQYEIRRAKFRVPFIKHVLAEHLLEYQMIIKLNEPGSIHYSSKVFTHSFLGFKFYLKNNVILNLLHVAYPKAAFLGLYSLLYI